MGAHVQVNKYSGELIDDFSPVGMWNAETESIEFDEEDE